MDPTILSTLSSIATLLTPFLLAFLAAMGWLLRNRIATGQARQDAHLVRIRELEDRLREDRIATYNRLLEPFFILFTSEAAFSQDPKYKNKKKDDFAISQMLSVEYRQIGFKLSLLADDAVVRAYNRLMQFFYHSDNDARPLDQKTAQWISLMATLLLEIRKSMGNESSQLGRWEMIEWFMSDAIKIKSVHDAAN